MQLPITDCVPALGQVYTHPTCAAQRCTTPTLAEFAMSPFADDITGDEAVAELTDQLSGLQLIARRLDELPPLLPLPPQPSPLPPTHPPPPHASSASPPVSPPTAPSSCASPVFARHASGAAKSPIFARHASVMDLRHLYENNGLKDRVVLLMGHEVRNYNPVADMDELKEVDGGRRHTCRWRSWWDVPQDANEKNVFFSRSMWVINGEGDGALSCESDALYPSEVDEDAVWTHSSVTFRVHIKSIATASPTSAPSTSPTMSPTLAPTMSPSAAPTLAPISAPTLAPTYSPSAAPTQPTREPSTSPTIEPTAIPSAPTQARTVDPSLAPTNLPTQMCINLEQDFIFNVSVEAALLLEGTLDSMDKM